mmetsp:Transcript_47656/g.111539  ORF Transcript_47656/g.111539 Transcript_47656/m.111539 type:complete len:559 (-) Transcript_47656:139-1815(-)|eukprot:s2201_g16.t2
MIRQLLALLVFVRPPLGLATDCHEEDCETAEPGLLQTHAAQGYTLLRRREESVEEECWDCCHHLEDWQYCGWCPSHRSCTEVSGNGNDMVDKSCFTPPISSKKICWSAGCPSAMSDYVGKLGHKWKAKNKKIAEHSRLVYPYVTYKNNASHLTGIFDLVSGSPLREAHMGSRAEGIIVGGASDWASGACEADIVGRMLAKEGSHVTFHLGDTYPVGDLEDFQRNVMGSAPEPSTRGQHGVFWPKGSVTSFLMAGNHEAIDGMNGLVYAGYKYTAQRTSYGAWQSDSWRFIALDTGYLCYGFVNNTNRSRNLANETDAPQPDEIMEWLSQTVRLDDPNDKRGIVLMTHHQPYSDFERVYLGTAKQLNQMLKNRTVFWLFGHEHRFALYDKLKLNESNFTSDFALYPRMVGYGGYRNTPEGPKKRALKLKAWDQRLYQEVPNKNKKDKHAKHDMVKLGFNGYFKIVVNGQTLHISYIGAKCKDSGCEHGYNETDGELLANETVSVDLETGELSQKWYYFSPVLNVTDEADMMQGPYAAETIPVKPGQMGMYYNLEHTSMD